jgi:dehydrogenase/reductase SDR family protein 4
MIDGNFKSHFFTTKIFLDIIPENQNSSIIFISSYVGKSPNNLIGIYSVTKTALMSLTLILSKELLDKNIRVNCILPGLIRTEFSK